MPNPTGIKTASGIIPCTLIRENAKTSVVRLENGTTITTKRHKLIYNEENARAAVDDLMTQAEKE